MGTEAPEQSCHEQQQLPLKPHCVKWSTDLCDCCKDPLICLFTCFCPCIAFGQIAEIIDSGRTPCAVASIIFYALSCVGCSCMYSCIYRARLRKTYSLNESPCADCLVHFFCELCAICQEYQELKNRDADPFLGWQRNVEKLHQCGSTMPPAVAPGMIR